MTLGQDHDTPLGHGQQLCEILSRTNLAVRSYGSDVDFEYVCTVTLTLEIRPWVKFITHPWVMDNYCVKYYPDQTSGCKVMTQTRCEQTDRRTDRQTDRRNFVYKRRFIYKLLNVCHFNDTAVARRGKIVNNVNQTS